MNFMPFYLRHFTHYTSDAVRQPLIIFALRDDTTCLYISLAPVKSYVVHDPIYRVIAKLAHAVPDNCLARQGIFLIENSLDYIFNGFDRIFFFPYLEYSFLRQFRYAVVASLVTLNKKILSKPLKI